MILNQAQAEAIYSAMCALNNVGGRIAVMIDFNKASEREIVQDNYGNVLVKSDLGMKVERHTSQAAFAAAYSLS